jgi:hypothetical protein
MNFRDPAIIVPGAAGAGFLFLPGRGLMLPAALFGPPQWQWVIPMALVIFAVVYFGTLGFWKLLTGEALGKPFPALLALFLFIRLSVDCARIMMWRY